MNQWFGRFPFPGWLLLVFLFLSVDIVFYQYEKAQYSPEKMAAAVQQDFTDREMELREAVRLGQFSLPLSNQFLTNYKNSFSVVVFKDSQPVFWNAVEIPEVPVLLSKFDSLLNGKVVRLQAGIFYAKSFFLKESNERAVSLIPIAYQYKYPHKYFHSYCVAGNDIPSDVVIGSKGFKVNNLDGVTVFHLNFETNTFELFTINGWIGLLTFLVLAFAFIWVHKFCIEIGKRSLPIKGWLVLFIFSVLFNVFRNIFGYPLGFENAGFFSPKLLASGSNIGSFPDLCFYVFFDTWLSLYFVKYVPVKGLIRIKHALLSKIIRLAIVVILIVELFYGQAGNMYSLIMDSKLPFVVNDLQSLSVYTFLGIGLMCLITLNFIFIISIASSLLKGLFKSQWLRYSIFTVVCLVSVVLWYHQELNAFNITLLIFSTAALLLLDKFGLPIADFKNRKDLLGTPQTYIWFLILCSWVTFEIYYFNFSKERELRKVFAGRVEQRDDALLFYSFNTVSEELQQDKLLKTFWNKPSFQAGQSIDKHIIFHYLGGAFQKYQASVYFYNAQRIPLFNSDSLDKSLLRRADSLAGTRMENGLISLENPVGKNMYWGMFPVFDDSGKKKLGYVGIDFSTDNSPRKSPVSMLFLPEYNSSDEQYFSDYAYAVYRKHKLEAQVGDFSFPYLSYFDSQQKAYTFKDYWSYSDLFYQTSGDELILVRYQRNVGANIISLFSYVLACWLVLSGLFFLVNYFITHPEKGRQWRNQLNLTIRAKVNWTIMVTVFLSLIVVGGITVSYLKSRYQETQSQKLRNLMFYFGQSIVHFIESQQTDDAINHEQATNQSPPLVYLLNTLAGEQGVDINLYNNQGGLMATSQSLLLQKGYLPTLMNPRAYYQLKEGMQSDWQGKEKIGELDYQSLYLPLRNKQDAIIAYLNLPYYGFQSNLKSEISGILSTLINIYMLIFFIAGISALLISNSIVRSYYLLIEQFRKIRLEHNVLIHWPFRDELGLLVNEYNNMILKVERMATRLANSEREAAWRELALQIAHEIKNPLTPMKLNIQYLRKSIRENRGDVIVLAERISDSLIEQIENLNLIATEFAHFARMPEAHPEVISIKELLQSLISLYQNETVTIRLNIFESADVKLWMDKSYFIRIFTNLIKNGIQAIPEGKDGVIEISVVFVAIRKVLITVKDNGSGISEAVQKRIFTPYFTTKSSGTGIGLAMSKNMVELSKGTIDFETQMGKGTSFFVMLPVYEA